MIKNECIPVSTLCFESFEGDGGEKGGRTVISLVVFPSVQPFMLRFPDVMNVV